MIAEDFAKAMVCLTAFREERSNGLVGQQAVLNVIYNRTKHPEFGFSNNIYHNITVKNQFSSMTVVGDTQTVVYPDLANQDFVKLMQYVDLLFDGKVIDRLTNGALYYADLGSPGFDEHGWFANTILASPERFPRVAKVGSTDYFSQLT